MSTVGIYIHVKVYVYVVFVYVCGVCISMHVQRPKEVTGYPEVSLSILLP